MTDSRTDPSGTDRRVTRRRFLGRAGGTAVAGTAVAGTAFSDRARAQALTSRQMVFEEIPVDDIEANSHFVVLTDRLEEGSQEIDPSVAADCDAVEISPDDTRTYEGLIVDRLRQDPQGYEREILTNAREPPVERGSVFIISNGEPCSNGYVGVEAEAISDNSAPLGTETPGGADPGSGPIPGFGAAGVVAALAGLLGLARWRGKDE